MTDLGIILMAVANSGVFAYIGFNLKERESNKEEFRLPYLRLFFLGASVLNMLLGAILGLVIANNGSLVNALEIYLWFMGFVFLIYLIGNLEAIFFAKNRWNKLKEKEQ